MDAIETLLEAGSRVVAVKAGRKGRLVGGDERIQAIGSYKTKPVLEALLSEAAYVKNPQVYKQNMFRYAGVPVKFRMLMGNGLSDISPHADELWKWRNALCHTEPGSERTRFVGTRISADGTRWVVQAVEKLAVIIWAEDMPDWFTLTTGLKPMS